MEREEEAKQFMTKLQLQQDSTGTLECKRHIRLSQLEARELGFHTSSPRGTQAPDRSAFGTSQQSASAKSHKCVFRSKSTMEIGSATAIVKESEGFWREHQ